MLQQTQVDRVVPRYLRWLERWPTVEALAGAQPAEVIVEWQGLGYNRRAVSLHRAARVVAARGWPEDLTELPGVGPYTAAAVGNFAFGRDVLPVDTNVRRVQERTGEALRRATAPRRSSTSAHGLPRAGPALRRCPLAAGCPSRGRRYEPLRRQSRLRGLVPPASRASRCAPSPPAPTRATTRSALACARTRRRCVAALSTGTTGVRCRR